MYYGAKQILDAVDHWAFGAHMIREIEIFGPDCKAAGRVDGLLMTLSPWEAPWSKSLRRWAWSAARLVGVEVKVSRNDFKKGLESGQFNRYADVLGSLYVATPKDLVKTSEIPKRFGHLVVRHVKGGWRASCRRHPVFEEQEVAPELIWKLVHRLHKSHMEELGEIRDRNKRVYERLGDRFGAALRALED